MSSMNLLHFDIWFLKIPTGFAFLMCWRACTLNICENTLIINSYKKSVSFCKYLCNELLFLSLNFSSRYSLKKWVRNKENMVFASMFYALTLKPNLLRNIVLKNNTFHKKYNPSTVSPTDSGMGDLLVTRNKIWRVLK